MDPIQNDVNIAPVVTESGVVEAAPTGENAQVATEQVVQPQEGVSQEAAAATAEQQEESKGPVPYDRFAEVNKAKTDAEAEVARLQEHVGLLGKQPQQQTAQPAQQAQPTEQSLTLQVMKQLNMDPDGIATNAEMAQVTDIVSRMMQQQATSQANTASFVASHTDFADVVGVNGADGNFVYAPPLLRAMEADPTLMQDLQNAGPSANRIAYRIASQDPTYRAEVAAKQAEVDKANGQNAVQVAGNVTEQAVQAAKGMTSVSAAGVGANLDRGALFNAMTDEQIKAHSEKVMREGGVAI